IRDILIAGRKIAQVGKDLDPPRGYDCQTIDAHGKIAYPGFVDIHIHSTGADDGQGPVGRTFDIDWRDIVESGITTTVGVQGGSIWVRSLEKLYIKTLELEMMGITSYMLTGCFKISPPTLTGSIRKDLYLIEKVKGIKTAISDPTTAHHTWRDLAAVASEVRIGAGMAKKGAITHVHVGRNPTRMDVMLEMVERTGLNPQHVVPTHVNRFNPDVIEQGIEYVKQGGVVDLSSLMRKEEGTLTGRKVEYAVKRMLKAGCDIENITVSSDGNVPMPIRDEDGRQVGMYIAPLDFNRREIRDIVNSNVAQFSEALKMVTTNPARILGIGDTKGEIRNGHDADIVIADSVESLRIEEVYAKGKMQVEDGKSLFQGHYQQDPYYSQYR
ncbi:beta-aspartyl-peptidase, partial [Candidatus Bathyarchaeota archaeon]|nr:beta-aspartyl-peptidase [Candidatus Bathyarchaeota archaeon]